MIVDDLAKSYPGFRKFAEIATIVRVPFPVLPYDDSDGVPGILWTEGRIPKGLAPRTEEPRLEEGWTLDGSYADPPYAHIIIVSEHEEPGCVLVAARKAAPQEAETFFRSVVPPAHSGPMLSEENLNLMRRARWFCASASVWAYQQTLSAFPSQFFISDRVLPSVQHNGRLLNQLAADGAIEMCREGLAYLWRDRAVWGHGMDLTDAPSLEDLQASVARLPETLVRENLKDIGNDSTHTMHTVITTMALLNARNVVLDTVEPQHPRASRRRGEPAPYRYHVLRVKVPATRTNRALGETFTDEHVAIHWVRGHFKKYTDAKPLFGKLTGLYWWQPHLAGQGRGVVDKDYAIQTAQAAHAG